jgi:hypothetical protein
MTADMRATWDRLANDIATGASSGALDHPPRLVELGDVFGLTAFERDVLLLAAGCEVHPPLAAAIAKAGANVAAAHLRPALALACLDEGHWDAFAPLSPLRAWLLIDLDPGAPLLNAPLRIDAAIAPWLLGGTVHDPVIAALVADGRPAPGEHARASQLADALLADDVAAPRLTLTGPDARLREQLACAVAARLGRRAWVLDGAALPERADAADALGRRLSRAAALEGRLLVLDLDTLADPVARCRASWLLHRLQMPVIVSVREPLPGFGAVAYNVEPPPVAARRVLWERALGAGVAELNGQVERLAGHFALGPSAVDEIARRTRDVPAAERAGAVWALARAHTRPALAELATPVEVGTDWDAIVLPEDQIAVLRAICAQVRNRHVVYGTWAMAPASGRGRGITALFAGPSGTGKTLAAEVIGNDLGLDVFRIDLSSVVSKYIGETEKNLRRVFDAAEHGSAVLLFDEADALFGKRTEIKDSHDRFANIEVSYLLQRMESYGGLAILTSNMRDALDEAFLRRLRFIVEFPFPDAAARRRIWETMYPASVPLAELHYDALARLSIAGGSIRTVALNAAFHAAQSGAPVGMGHVLEAARGEYAKLQRPLSAGELAGFRA